MARKGHSRKDKDFWGRKIVAKGATGFDGVGEAVAACPGPRILVKPSGRFTTANDNLALAA